MAGRRNSLSVVCPSDFVLRVAIVLLLAQRVMLREQVFDPRHHLIARESFGWHDRIDDPLSVDLDLPANEPDVTGM